MNCPKCNTIMQVVLLRVAKGAVTIVDECPRCNWRGKEYSHQLETFEEYMTLKEEVENADRGRD